MPYLLDQLFVDQLRVFSRGDEARDVEPVAMRQIATDQLLYEPGHRRGHTAVLHVVISQEAARLLPNHGQTVVTRAVLAPVE